MPFKSEDQMKYLFANEPEVAREYAKKTSKKQMKNLPKKVNKKKGK